MREKFSFVMEVIRAENYDFEDIQLTSKSYGDTLELEVELSHFGIGRWVLKRVLFAMGLATLFYALWVSFWSFIN